jgi:phage baseplate assembly protein W
VALRVPKLKVPVEMGTTGLKTVEQDSDDEIAQCVYAVLATERGTRIEEPDFGITDPTFEMNGLDTGEALLQIHTWEPRADVEIEEDIEDLVDEVRVEVSRS